MNHGFTLTLLNVVFSRQIYNHLYNSEKHRIYSAAGCDVGVAAIFAVACYLSLFLRL